MKLLLLGDVCPTDITAKMYAEGDVEWLFTDTKALFEKADFSIVNLECAITESENRIKKFGPNLKAPFGTEKTLKAVGVDCCAISNNHVYDFGIEGIKDTLASLNRVGLDYTGFGDNYEDSRKNYFINKNGEKIAVVAVCEHEYSYALENRMGSRPFDEYDTIEDVRAAKAEADRVIVLYHGGKEHCRYPSPRLVKLCRALVRNGADVVLCQHSHCIGAYENYRDGHILYGQGNFQFIWDGRGEGWYSAFATAYNTDDNTIEFIPIVSSTDGRISLAKGEEKDKIMADFEKRNEELANGEWRKGWHDFCLEMTYYTEVIANAYTPTSTERQNAAIGHYLDCEAHTDVWKELNPTYHLTNE